MPKNPASGNQSRKTPQGGANMRIPPDDMALLDQIAKAAYLQNRTDACLYAIRFVWHEYLEPRVSAKAAQASKQNGEGKS